MGGQINLTTVGKIDKIEQSSGDARNESTVRPAFVFWFLLGIVLIGADQATKFLAFRLDRPGQLGWLVSRQNFFNNRFAFSLPLPAAVMGLAYLLVLAGLARYVAARGSSFSNLQALAVVLIFAGGISNVAERWRLGGVRDFIAIRWLNWIGYYNLADFYILAGIILLFLISTFSKRTLRR